MACESRLAAIATGFRVCLVIPYIGVGSPTSRFYGRARCRSLRSYFGRGIRCPARSALDELREPGGFSVSSGARPSRGHILGGVRVRLAPGVEPERAIAEMNELIGGRATAVMPTARGKPVDERESYVRWATNMEARLSSVLSRKDAQAFFNSPRHRDICSMPPGNQLTTLIYAEVDTMMRDMQEAVNDLEDHLRRMRSAPGFPVVVDSNVLLQCQRLDNVNWRERLKAQARVMVPLRIIEEIDSKKYGPSKRLRSIARELLPWVDSLFPDGDPGPVPLRDDATIELILADRPRYRPSDADEEVLEVAHDVARFAGMVKVMTADTGMRIRARGERLDVLFVPDEWRRATGGGEPE